MGSHVNPLTPMSDQDRISPDNKYTISSRQVTRIKKNINKGIISSSNTKFCKLNITRTVWQTVRRITSEILGVKGLRKYFQLFIQIQRKCLVFNLPCRSSEGKTVEVPYRGNVHDTVKDILGGVRSTCTYVGAEKLKELPRRTTFIRVTMQLNNVFS